MVGLPASGEVAVPLSPNAELGPPPIVVAGGRCPAEARNRLRCRHRRDGRPAACRRHHLRDHPHACHACHAGTHGIGKAILAALEDTARRLGYRLAVLLTGPDQHPAIDIYKAAGFQVVSFEHHGELVGVRLHKVLEAMS
jgi:hypothetical protein